MGGLGWLAATTLIGLHFTLLTCNSNVLKLWHQLAIKATHCVSCQEPCPLTCQHLVDPVREISLTIIISNVKDVLLDQSVGQGLLAHFVSLEEHQLELTVDILNLLIDLLAM